MTSPACSPRSPGCFPARGFNIESLAVGPTEERGLSRLTLEVLTDDQQTELLCNQLSKMVPVHSVRLLAEEHSIRREMVLCKVRAEERSVRSELIQLPSCPQPGQLKLQPDYEVSNYTSD